MTAPDSVHRNALAPGYRIHWYTLDSVLGQGGFGITYLARDTNLAQRVAIKEYLPLELAVREPDCSVHANSTDHEELYRWGLERFVSEGRTLARFDHANIVRVMAVFEANNTAYLVMRYEEGTTLGDALKGRQTLDEDRLLGILLPLLDGLELVHAEGFIHRDIKPANIFLRADGSPVLIDFGSARQALGHETRTLTTLVSPGYAPFEQYSNRSGEQGPWTDIYSLAATMYRGIAGLSPPDAVDRSHRLHGDEPDPLVPAVEVGKARYSPAFLQSIDWGLRFRRQDRPQSIAPWRDALKSDRRPGTQVPTTRRAASDPPPASPAATRDTDAETVRFREQGEPGTAPSGAVEVRRSPVNRRAVVAFVALIIGSAIVGAYVLSDRRSEDATASQRAVDGPPRDLPADSTRASVTGPTAPAADSSGLPGTASETETDLAGRLEEARRHVAAGRTIWPAGDNAFESYRAVLERDPANEEARTGLRMLARNEVGAVLDAIAKKDLARAEKNLDRLIELVPDSERLTRLREQVRRASAQSR
jgi:serine/threonine protein kinase